MAILTAPTDAQPEHPRIGRCALCGRPTPGLLCSNCTRLPDRQPDREPGDRLDAVITWCDRCHLDTGQALAGDGTATCTSCGRVRVINPPAGWNPRTCPHTIVPDPDNPLLCPTCQGIGQRTHQTRTRACTDCAGTGRS